MATTAAHRAADEEVLSPLEQEVLDEYAHLAGNLDKLSHILADLSTRPSAEILDALRGLERKTATVFTLLKASVYSIVLQQEIFSEEQGMSQ
ncbi:DASH complex subunit dad3 [Elsinoe australis]|uniref:DASH complex subunit DAD3 n=1 Tax=Elsinoe australis TaxID=40998 RepID=A0A2P8AFK2_9PEZI|nr:DASH complex subunit dad3 [Elsinoe australis]